MIGAMRSRQVGGCSERILMKNAGRHSRHSETSPLGQKRDFSGVKRINGPFTGENDLRGRGGRRKEEAPDTGYAVVSPNPYEEVVLERSEFCSDFPLKTRKRFFRLITPRRRSVGG